MDYKLNLTLFKESPSGHNVDSEDNLVKKDYEYSYVAWFFVTFFGTTRLPKKITFSEVATDQIFEVITDQSLIEHYMLYRRK